MKSLLDQLVAEYPDVSFKAGNQFYWSPAKKKITYVAELLEEETGLWALMHELAHADLGHTSYETDFELLMLEVAAWEHAKKLGLRSGQKISDDHIQDCLDTYRDWLDQRSTCPMCGNNSLQQNSQLYRCFNCRSEWRVSSSRFCRPYRLTMAQNKKLPAEHDAPKATFQ